MPLYEYQCHKCGKKFDALQKFSDPPLATHEECGGELEKLISSPAFHFKGTGWYVTDYAKSNGVSAPAADGAKADSNASDSKTDSKSDSKTDSKAETKSETKTEAPAAKTTLSTDTPSSSTK